MTLYSLLLIYLKVTMSKVYDLSLVDNIFDITIIFVHNNISIFAKKTREIIFRNYNQSIFLFLFYLYLTYLNYYMYFSMKN